MLTKFMTAAAAIATLATAAAPAIAQSRADDDRFRAAQQRFDREYQLFRQEADRYAAARSRVGYNDSYRPANDYRDDDRYDPNYDPSRYYRASGSEQVLSPNDRIYAGTDGRYYCKRSDGTTGLIVGAAGGGILGNVIDGGHSRTVGTLLGAAIGAVAGRAVDQNNSQVRCR